MRKFALTVLIAVVVTIPVAPTAASTRLVSAPTCEEPQPVRRYDGQGMTYRLAIDLSGCTWWDGSPIQLEASLSRLDGTGEEGATTIVLCGGRILGERQASGEEDATAEGDDAAAGGSYHRQERSTCEVAIGLEHPPVEFARYRGEVTYPWREGKRTVKFVTYCASPGRVCHDG